MKRKNERDNNQMDDSKNKKLTIYLYNSSIFTFIKKNFQPFNNYAERKNSLNNIMTIGYFHLIPEEIRFKIFHFLTTNELSILVLTNSRIRDFVIESFLVQPTGFMLLIKKNQIKVDSPDQLDQSASHNFFSTIGLLLKRCTLIFPTQERIFLLIHLFKISYGAISIKFFDYYDYNTLKTIFKCYGKMINELITGWGTFECEKMYDFLKEYCQIGSFIKKFLKCSLGSNQKQELFIRNFFRMICARLGFSIETFKDKIYWLLKVLTLYSPLEMAKIFIVIFGPLVTLNNSVYSLPYIPWWDLTDSSFAENGLEELGLTFHFLHKHPNEPVWNKDNLIELFEAIIKTPTTWTHINVAIFLYYSGFEMSLCFLSKKLKDGHASEVAAYICNICIIIHKLSQDLFFVLKLIDFSIDIYGEEFIEEIILAFSNIIYDINSINEEDLFDFFNLYEVFESQLELMKLLFLKINHFKKFM